MISDGLLFSGGVLGLIEAYVPCFCGGGFFLSLAFDCLFEEFGVVCFANVGSSVISIVSRGSVCVCV